MKRLYYFLTVALVMLLQGTSFAQGVLTFETENYDFGNVSEGTQATYEFKFKNTGNQPIIISHVQASCGCTTPDWTKEPVAPGKTGIVKAVYNSAGRPGAFNKAITVTSNGTPDQKVLFIKGTVVDKPAVPAYTAEQIAKSPKISFTSTTYDFGKVEKGQKVKAKFTLKNTGKDNLTLSGIQSSCNCVTYTLTPTIVKPGQAAKLELTYMPQVLQDRIETITLASNDITGTSTSLTLKAKVVDSLSKQSMLKVNKAAVPFK